jgi:hypothetical protein
MLRALTIATPFLLVPAMAWADDPPPARQPAQRDQPRAAPAQPAQRDQPRGVPGQPAPREGGFGRFVPPALARYEEEVEVLEAQLEVKRAYVKAAEAGTVGPKVKYKHASFLHDQKVSGNRSGIVSEEEVLLAKSELDAAMAQVDIRKAEMKEVEVRLKYAKKRLDGAKQPNPPPPPRERGYPERDRGESRPKDPAK